MIQVLYFASLRENLGCTGEQISLSDEISDISSLKDWLAKRGGAWHEAFSENTMLMSSVNQQMASHDDGITDGDEIAFFPPVTGG